MAADFAALFNSGADVSPSAFHNLLSQLITALKTPLHFPDITEFSGDHGINTIQTMELTVNTRIRISVGSISIPYILKAGDSETSGAFIIRPNDYNADTNAKYWQIDGVTYVIFTENDLESLKLRVTHNFGVKVVDVMVYDPTNKNLLIRVFDTPGNNQFSVVLKDKDYCDLIFNESLSGTYGAIIRF